MKFICIFITFFCISTLAFSQQKKILNEDILKLEKRIKYNKTDVKALKQITELQINVGNYSKTIYYAHILDSIAQNIGDQTYQMYAYIYLGQAMMMSGEEKMSKEYMEKSLSIANKLSNDSALASVYNGLGLYSSNIEMDYYRALLYFFEGIEAAKRSSHDRLYSILLCNISGIYYLKGDTDGLKYAQECYELGHEKDDPYLIFCGSMNSAYIYYSLKDHEKALSYIKEAEFIMEKNHIFDKANLYNLYGNILLDQGDNNSAIDMFLKALKDKNQSQISSIVNAYISISKAYSIIGKPKESIKFLHDGLNFTLTNKNNIYILDLYNKLSEAYEHSGDYPNAMKYYKEYHSIYDKVFNADKERSLSELRIKYETEKYENTIKENKLELLEQEKKNQLLLSGFILIALVSGGTYILYHKKNKLYLQIIKQNQKSIKKEKNLEEQIEYLKKNTNTASEKYTVSSLSEEKEIELYNRLITLLQKNKTYRHNDLTKDKLAALLNTNRTYLSQIINKNTNLSYNHFINSFRIDEAIRILSDPNNDIPLKAISIDLGFNSIATFYSAFQFAVGMPPSVYREKVLDLKKQEAKNSTL